MKLARKLTRTTPPTIRLAFAAGMMMAMNMPYRATLSALTRDTGRTLPATTPMAVPKAQLGRAIVMAP